MAYAQVYLNGTYLGEHKGGYTPFSFSVDQLLKPDGDNEITVVVDSTERNDIPPFGGQIDYLTYGGIYREVYLDLYEPVHIKNARIEPIHVLDEHKGLQVNCWIENTSLASAVETTLDIQLLDSDGKVVFDTEKTLTCPSGQSQISFQFEDIESHENGHLVKLWTLEDPALTPPN